MTCGIRRDPTSSQETRSRSGAKAQWRPPSRDDTTIAERSRDKMSPCECSMPDPILIYGATGYTGRLIIRELQRRGIEPVLAGRNAVRLSVLAEEFDLPFRAAPLHSPRELDSALGGVSVVLHAAGPFSGTARPML